MEFQPAGSEPTGAKLANQPAGVIPVGLGDDQGWGLSTMVAAGNAAQAIIVGTNQVTFGGAAPTTGMWTVGDICHSNVVSSSTAPGWVCTVAGGPGTWVALPASAPTAPSKIAVGTNHLTFGGAAPTTGTWVVGDVCFSTVVTATGTPPYWICTTAGTPGTWTASPNLA